MATETQNRYKSIDSNKVDRPQVSVVINITDKGGIKPTEDSISSENNSKVYQTNKTHPKLSITQKLQFLASPPLKKRKITDGASEESWLKAKRTTINFAHQFGTRILNKEMIGETASYGPDFHIRLCNKLINSTKRYYHERHKQTILQFIW